MSVTREALYAEVWAEPMTTVAARYQRTSTFLARICRRMNVPTPPRGYWAKLAVGKAPSRPELPEARPDDELEWLLNGEAPTRRREPPKPPRAPASGGTLVLTRPTKKHLLVAEALPHFAEAKAREIEERKSGRLRFFGRRGFLLPRKRNIVDVFVSIEEIDRALELANRLFVRLEAHGYRVALAARDARFQRPPIRNQQRVYGANEWQPGRATIVNVGTVAIGLTLYETVEVVPARWLDGKYVRVAEPKDTGRRTYWDTPSRHELPTGRLVVRAYSPYEDTSWQKEWAEAKGSALGPRLPDIVNELTAAAPEIATLAGEADRRAEERQREWAEKQRIWAEEERQRQREEAERRRREAWQASREALVAAVDEWALARHIEQFLVDASNKADALPTTERNAIHSKIAAARVVLARADPLHLLREWEPPEE